ncbi:MAG: NUDIX domain-containing protein [Candidatus Omnitrophica bacterium]|nr:NUDIX domain-containing protein [Candidatus Omnitrophota bacterium]
MNKEYSSGGVIFRKEAGTVLFLIIYSARNKLWGFPKGHIEPNETEQEAALREITEETGLQDLRVVDGFREEDVYEALNNRGQFKGQKIEKHSVYFLMETLKKSVVV